MKTNKNINKARGK